MHVQGWLLPSEIQPLETRSAGQGLTVAVNFLFTFLIGQSFLSMLCAFQVSPLPLYMCTFFTCAWCFTLQSQKHAPGKICACPCHHEAH